ncbi:MAG: hypothetical protein ACPLPR_02050 [Bacillota bacterium]
MPKKTDWQELYSPQQRNNRQQTALDANRFQYEVANEIGVTGKVSPQQAAQWDAETRSRKGNTENRGGTGTNQQAQKGQS